MTSPVFVVVEWYAKREFNLLTNHRNRATCRFSMEVRLRTWSGQMPAVFLLVLLGAGLCGARHYTNYTSSWLVKVNGSKEVADAVAAEFNLTNRGQVRGEEEEGATSRRYK